MTTFAEMNDISKKISSGNKLYIAVTIFFLFITIPQILEKNNNAIMIKRSYDVDTIKNLLICFAVYLPVMYLIFWLMKKLKAALLACKTAIESDPVLLAEYHADKNQHDFNEAVQNIRNHIRDCYHKIELCERNGQYQMAAKYRGDISTLESKLRQLGC